MYCKENVFKFEGKSYEEMFNHPELIRFRVILSEDDYDYIEDEELIRRLSNDRR